MEGSFPITHIDHKINIDMVTVDPDILYAPVLETWIISTCACKCTCKLSGKRICTYKRLVYITAHFSRLIYM